MQDTSTTSMPAAAFAVAHRKDLPRLELLGSERYKFFFDDPTGEVSRLIVAYFNGAPAPACAFYKALQTIRANVNRAKHGGAR